MMIPSPPGEGGSGTQQEAAGQRQQGGARGHCEETGAELPETETSDVMVTSGAHVVHVEHGSSTN